jgi:hypothetical protein
VIATWSEVFGGCVERIDVAIKVEYGGVWLCCGWKYLRLFGRGERLKIGGIGRRWCQVSDAVFEASGDV